MYAALLPVLRPLYPVLRRLMPKSTTTTENIGRAMLAVKTQTKRVLENPDINAVGQPAG